MAKQKQGGKRQKPESSPASKKKKGGPQRPSARRRGSAARCCEQCGGTDNSCNHRVQDSKTGIWCYVQGRCRPQSCTYCDKAIIAGHVQTDHKDCGLLTRTVLHTIVPSHTPAAPNTAKRITDASGRSVPAEGDQCPHCEARVEGPLFHHFTVKRSPRTGRTNVQWQCTNAATVRRRVEAEQAAAEAKKQAAETATRRASVSPRHWASTSYIGRWKNYDRWECTNPLCPQRSDQYTGTICTARNAECFECWSCQRPPMEYRPSRDEMSW